MTCRQLGAVWSHMCNRINDNLTEFTYPMALLQSDGGTSRPDTVLRELNCNVFMKNHPNIWLVVYDFVRRLGYPMTFRTCRVLITVATNIVCMLHDDDYVSVHWTTVIGFPKPAPVRALERLQVMFLQRVDWMPMSGLMRDSDSTMVMGHDAEVSGHDMASVMWLMRRARELDYEYSQTSGK